MKNFNDYAKYEELSVLKDFFLKNGRYKEVGKKEYFTRQGFPATCAAYIKKGMFRYICMDDGGCEHIVGYSFTGEYIGDYPYFLKGENAVVSIQAAACSQIYYATTEEIKMFFFTNEAAQNVERVLAKGLFMQVYKRLLDIYCKTPVELYMELEKRCPDFQNYITLREVASFLRVTPETISHIRRKLE